MFHVIQTNKKVSEIGQLYLIMGDNAVTSSIRFAKVFHKLVGKKTPASSKIYRGMLQYMTDYALYLALYDAYFHINDNAKKCRYFVSQIVLYSFILHLNCSHIKYCKKYSLPWIH